MIQSAIHSFDGTDHPALSVTGLKTLTIQNVEHDLDGSNHPNLNLNKNISIISSQHKFDGTDHPSLSVGANQTLTIANSNHDLATDVFDLSKSVSLGSRDSILSHVSGRPELSLQEELTLTTQDITHGLVSDVADLTPEVVYWTDEETGISFIDDEVDFIPQHIRLEIQDSRLCHITEDLTLIYGQEQLLTIQKPAHGVITDGPTPTSNNLLTILDSTLAFSGTHPTLAVHEELTLSVQNISHKISSEIVGAIIDAQLTSINSELDFTRSSVLITTVQNLNIKDSNHEFDGTDHPTLSAGAEQTLSIQSGKLGLIADVLLIEKNVTLLPIQSSHEFLGDHPVLAFGGEQILSIFNSTCQHSTENVINLVDLYLQANDSVFDQTADILNISGQNLISIFNSQLNHNASRPNILKSKIISVQNPVIQIEGDTVSINVTNELQIQNVFHLIKGDIAQASTAQWLDMINSIHGQIVEDVNVMCGLPYAINFIARDSPYAFKAIDDEYNYILRKRAA